MKIPITTKEKPYIEFTFDTKNNLTLSATSNWWGGIKENFVFFKNGEEIQGNTCKPKDLEKYITAFKKNRIKEVKKEIAILQKKLKQLNSISENLELEVDLIADSDTVSLS